MKPRIEFVVPGPPVPAARPRVNPLYGRGGKLITTAEGRPILTAHTPEKTEEYEQRVAFCARAALARRPDWVQLALSDARFRVHLHWVRTVDQGDIDNLEKAVLDGLTKAGEHKPHPTEKVRGKPRMVFVRGIWRDDRRVTEVIKSITTDPKGTPRTEVLIETATMDLQEPLWMRKAREEGWSYRPTNERPKEEATIPVLGDALER